MNHPLPPRNVPVRDIPGNADPFAYSRRLLAEARERGDDEPLGDGEQRKALPEWMNADRERE